MIGDQAFQKHDISIYRIRRSDIIRHEPSKASLSISFSLGEGIACDPDVYHDKHKGRMWCSNFGAFGLSCGVTAPSANSKRP